MGIFRRPQRRAKENAEAAPSGFCDACGNAVYASDGLTIRCLSLELTLHGSCAGQLENAIRGVRYQREWRGV